MHSILTIAVAIAAPPQGAPDDDIVVTASRETIPVAEAPVSTTIIGRAEMDALALPSATDLLRLVPGVSVSVTGPKGTQAQLRIRGAEANHSLLFLDGIRFNDPAAGNEARFELLLSDPLSRLEVVRGPLSALWGSEALGGVVAAETADPFQERDLSALAEYGSLDSSRLSAQAAAELGDVGISASGSRTRSDGIDSFGANGDRDGFQNHAASLKAVFRPVEFGEIGLVGHYIDSDFDYDGLDPVTFRRADTLDSTRNRIAAIRGWTRTEAAGVALSFDGSYLASTNRNLLAENPLNRTSGSRFTLGGQISKTFGGHRLTAAVEHETETFRARDPGNFGAADQDRSRELTAFIGEWHARWTEAITTDLAVRHDEFSAFRDSTTLRAAALVKPSEAWTLHLGYGEGIAQPTFYDLFGFFPGSFVGNPALRPESSKGWEAGVRWQSKGTSIGITGFSNRLTDEIVGVFDPATFLSSTRNSAGKSRRRGVEVEAKHHFSALAQLALNYSYLQAKEPQIAGGGLLRETRRPKHSANAVLIGSPGPFSWGATLAYVGKRIDSDFDLFPAPRVTLDDYVLGSLRLAYRVTRQLEAYGRIENAFGADYQDVVGYNTPGRTVHAGLRLRLGS